MNELRFFKDGFEVRTETDGKVNAVNFRRRFGRWESDGNAKETINTLYNMTGKEKEAIVERTFSEITTECIRRVQLATVRDLVIALMDCDPNAEISVYRGNGDYTELRDVDLQIVSDDTGESKQAILWADGDADEETEHWRIGEAPKEGQLCELYVEYKRANDEPHNDLWIATWEKKSGWIDEDGTPIYTDTKDFYRRILAWRPFTPPVMREKC